MSNTSIGRLFAVIGADTTEWDRKMKGLGKSATKVGKTLTKNLTLPILALGAVAVKTTMDFEQSLTNAAAVAGATGEQFKEMEKIARDMGATTVFSAKEAADGLYFMASAGWDVDRMGKAIRPTLDLAAATQSDLAFTTETVVSALNAFGLESSEATRVTDAFAGAIGSSQATLEKLSNSMTYIGPIAKSLGWSIEETSAALGLLYDRGIPAATAGTSLRMAMMKLLDPTAKVHKGLKSLGLTIEEVDPRFNSLDKVVEAFGKTTMDAQAMTQIFGARGMTAILKLADAGAPALTDLTDKISRTGTTAEMAERMISTFKGQVKLLTSALTEVAIQIGQIIIPVLRKLINEHIMPAVTWFQELSDTTKKNVVMFAAFMALVGPSIMLIGKLATAFAGLNLATKTFGIAVAAAYVAYKGLIALREKHEKRTGKFINEETKAWQDLANEVGSFQEVLGKLIPIMQKQGMSYSKDMKPMFEDMKKQWGKAGSDVEQKSLPANMAQKLKKL